MLLALDVGNSNITAGVFAGRDLLATWRHETSSPSRVICRDLAVELRRRRLKITACVYGSVVPRLDAVFKRAIQSSLRCPFVAVTPSSRLGMKLLVSKPAQVGADRILNALAAYELTRGPAVVLDFGTATTFDCVSVSGDYLGGAIMLGPRLAAEALHDRTAKLPLVPVKRPRRAIGKDTLECIQAGLYYGYLGMISGMLARTIAEMRFQGGRSPRLLATGGLAFLFARDLPKNMRIERDLTLQGLRIAHGRLTGDKA